MKKISLKIKKYWYIMICFVILFLPVIVGDYTKDKSDIENRNLARLDAFYEVKNGNIKLISNPISAFSNWFKDHLGFREESIRLIAEIKYRIWNIIDDNQNLVGKEKNLYYLSENRTQLYDYTRVLEYNEDDLFHTNQNFSIYREKLKKRGIDFLVLLCANKETIYPEYMPNNINIVGRYNRFSQLSNYLQENSSLKVIWMGEILKKYKRKRLLYNKYHDTGHWNSLGAFYGYQSVMEELRKNDNYLKTLSFEDVIFESENIKGQLLYGAIKYEENVPLCKLIDDDSVDLVMDNPDFAKYKIYYHYKNKRLLNGKTILFIGDSYIYNFLLPIFAQSFENVYFVHRSYYDDVILEYAAPTAVVYEAVERTGISYIY